MFEFRHADTAQIQAAANHPIESGGVQYNATGPVPQEWDNKQATAHVNPIQSPYDSHAGYGDQYNRPIDINNTGKSFWNRLWPVIACGAGLFSDGYLNGVIGSVNTMLKRIYGKKYTATPAQSNVSSITFAGTVLGMLIFGYTSDKFSRKWSLFVSTIIVILFAILATASYAPSPSGLLTALVVFRFFLGIGIGGEYPAGSVACAESTGELKAGTRNKWFIMFTNVQIDFGFLVAAIVPMIVVLATTENHLETAWRICLGLGVIPPLSLLWLRTKLQEPEAFKQSNLTKQRTPYGLALRLYWGRLLVVSTIWFIYDFSAYSFGIYGSSITDSVLADTDPLWKSFGWNTLLTFFYMPGCILGAFVSDRLGPRKTLAYGIIVQGILGFAITGAYVTLTKPSNVGALCVLYGIFLGLGELGPGNNIGLLASKTSATPIRGQYYGFAAAIGKVGAFVGTYIFPYITKAAGDDKVKQGQYPFYVSSALCLFAGLLAFFLLPEVGQDTIEYEDARFKGFLQSHGWDTSRMGFAGAAGVPHLAGGYNMQLQRPRGSEGSEEHVVGKVA